MSDFNRWLQQRLTAHGIPTVVDGLFGPGTRNNLRAFQRRRDLPMSGTATAATVRALREDGATGGDSGAAKVPVKAPWVLEMERRKALHEVRDNSKLMAWLRSDGRTLGDPAKHPWCGDAVQTALALTLPDEPQLANPYWARNWVGWGRESRPRPGAVLAFSRPGGGGHVGFHVAEDAKCFHVLGGNQNNAITVAAIARDRLLGARVPISFDLDDLPLIQRAANSPIPLPPVSRNEA